MGGVRLRVEELRLVGAHLAKCLTRIHDVIGSMDNIEWAGQSSGHLYSATREIEMEGSKVPDHLWLHNEFEYSLWYLRP